MIAEIKRVSVPAAQFAKYWYDGSLAIIVPRSLGVLVGDTLCVHEMGSMRRIVFQVVCTDETPVCYLGDGVLLTLQRGGFA